SNNKYKTENDETISTQLSKNSVFKICILCPTQYTKKVYDKTKIYVTMTEFSNNGRSNAMKVTNWHIKNKNHNNKFLPLIVLDTLKKE
ncbi:MAG: hypothetical protein HUJ52_03905, partial [Malacoplasma sp.]|nr:hypothetical protein [Malacoplasma sp.]